MRNAVKETVNNSILGKENVKEKHTLLLTHARYNGQLTVMFSSHIILNRFPKRPY